MCGIAGILDLSGNRFEGDGPVRGMLAYLRHRGPDQYGIFLDGSLAMGSARLNIIDLAGGQQPIASEDERFWIVYNGEVFNYLELRQSLLERGHRFSTATDTEVVLHLFEDYGPECFKLLNGQFALAIWDTQNRTLCLARDRLGVRPLFYARRNGQLLFASEIKSLLAYDRSLVEIDPVGLDQAFTFWGALAPRTIFRGISELEAGSYLVISDGAMTYHRYWDLAFPSRADGPNAASSARSAEEYLEQLEDRLLQATRLRLRADVPVGTYLSGGLDSSLINALIRASSSAPLRSFSITFQHPQYDESRYQRLMADFLGTNHEILWIQDSDIGRAFPEVIWHTETPLLRTAPVPMFLLSRQVRDLHYKVILTGEGADEFLAGYDLFKEVKIRRFWAQQPESRIRPLLLKRLYQDIPMLAQARGEYLAAFFKDQLSEVEHPFYSHAVRWRNNRRNSRFFTAEIRGQIQRGLFQQEHPIDLPRAFSAWGALEKAQYIEARILLSQYLLSSQGDRVMMAHSVEGRFPFLDLEVVEFCSRLPSALKLKGLEEKWLLRRLARKWLPEEICARRKHPYRAPIHRGFFSPHPPDYVGELLSSQRLEESQLFQPRAVSSLVAKIRQGARISETEDMALAGILSTQLLHEQFIRSFPRQAPLGEEADVKVCFGPSYHQLSHL